MNDVLLVAGAAFIIAGAYLIVGVGAACLTAGLLLIATALGLERST